MLHVTVSCTPCLARYSGMLGMLFSLRVSSSCILRSSRHTQLLCHLLRVRRTVPSYILRHADSTWGSRHAEPESRTMVNGDSERRGNEIADNLTKEGREKEQPPSDLSYREVKTFIRNKKKAIFHCKTGGFNPKQDALHQLSRHQQTTVFVLRTGHCRLNSHPKRIDEKTSAQCPCGEEDQTPH